MGKFRFAPVILSAGLLLSVFTSHGLPATSLTCGSLVSGTINTSGQVDQYTYAGQAGGIITLTLADTGGFYPYTAAGATLYDPSSRKLLSFNANSQQQITLASTGIYVVQVYSGDLVHGGTYNLGLECRNPLQPAATLGCGGLANGTLTSAQVDQYVYAGQAGGIITLTLADTGGFYLYGGRCDSVRSFRKSAAELQCEQCATSNTRINWHLCSPGIFGRSGPRRERTIWDWNAVTRCSQLPR